MGPLDPLTVEPCGDCKWSLPATAEQLLQQEWNFLPQNSQSPTILGEGGSGVVYKRDFRLCRPECTKYSPVVCAVKRLDSTISQTIERRQREAEVMEALYKSSVCPLFQVLYNISELTFCFGWK